MVAVALARPQTYGPPAAPPPPPSFEPYGYQYGVQDALSGADFEKTEAQDATGNVAGSYRINLPDGRVQVRLNYLLLDLLALGPVEALCLTNLHDPQLVGF